MPFRGRPVSARFARCGRVLARDLLGPTQKDVFRAAACYGDATPISIPLKTPGRTIHSATTRWTISDSADTIDGSRSRS